MLNLPQRLQMMPNWDLYDIVSFQFTESASAGAIEKRPGARFQVVDLGVTARFSALNAFVEPDRYRTLDCWPVEGT
jgi:hypothetical protein